jgi:hypothetical protein
MGKLLVVDDDEALRRLMRLELSESYEVVCTGEPEQEAAVHPQKRSARRLRVSLKLKGTDVQGNQFEESAFTENVSLTEAGSSAPARRRSSYILFWKSM